MMMNGMMSAMMNPVFMQQQRLAQLSMMLSNPSLPPAVRSQLQTQYNQITGLLNQMGAPPPVVPPTAPRGRGRGANPGGQRRNPFLPDQPAGRGVGLNVMGRGAIASHLKRGRSDEGDAPSSGDEKRHRH
jgi:hypothetical protein